MSEYSTTPTAPSSFPSDDPSIKDRATDSMEVATRAGSDLAQTATDKAKDVTQETSRQARDLLGEAREQMHHQTGQQQQTLINNLRSVGEELGGMAHGGDQDGIAHDLVGQAADHAHALADWLDDRPPGKLLDELGAFARRRPGTFLIGAAMAGVLAGRLTRGIVATHTDGQPAQDTRSGSATHHPMTRSTGSDVAAPLGADVGAPDADATDRMGHGDAPATASLPYAGSQPGRQPRTAPGLGEASQ